MQVQFEGYAFGRFVLVPRRRTLTAGGEPVVLTARAFDILTLLVQHRDRVVTREEIVAYVWPGLAVGENNLTVQMSALRRALADHADGVVLIATIPGRGYQFVGEALALPAAGDDEAKDAPESSRTLTHTAMALATATRPPPPQAKAAAHIAKATAWRRHRLAIGMLIKLVLIAAALGWWQARRRAPQALAGPGVTPDGIAGYQQGVSGSPKLR
jgi:DNA-binding winged helix-turn-helix (wHTH) protein